MATDEKLATEKKLLELVKAHDEIRRQLIEARRQLIEALKDAYPEVSNEELEKVAPFGLISEAEFRAALSEFKRRRQAH